MNNIKRIRHLHSSAAFGLCLEDLKRAGALTVKQAVHDFFMRSQPNIPLDIVAGNINSKNFRETLYEFSRRVEQNASNGTDHGTANNTMLFGGKLKKSRYL